MIKVHVERVRAALSDLCEPLHDTFTWAEQIRRERLPELDEAELYGWHATHTIRALAHHKLRQKKGLLGEWKLSGKHSQNGALWLTDDNYRVQLLHAHADDHIPPPGTNAARRAYYSNPPLPRQLSLTGEANDRLLGLWRIDPELATPSFRIVRTIGPWKWGEKAKVDLEFVLPETAEELSDLEFQPTDEGLDLLMPPADGDEEGGGDARGVSG
ncbi:hypothetical protein [Nocardia asiatica]|uniref:hypothetical protein n=1 Tax=Nocardia asiatica TaxID=209252 RepID=UPI002457F7E6|nr:hypothetical protein [Nocardia asiatica]